MGVGVGVVDGAPVAPSSRMVWRILRCLIKQGISSLLSRAFSAFWIYPLYRGSLGQRPKICTCLSGFVGRLACPSDYLASWYFHAYETAKMNVNFAAKLCQVYQPVSFQETKEGYRGHTAKPQCKISLSARLR